MIRIAVATVLALWLAVGHAAVTTLPQQSRVPGGIAVIDLGPAQGVKPAVRYDNRPVMVLDHSGRWTAVVGIPLSAEPGQQHLAVGSRTVNFEIHDKQYDVQRIHLKNTRKVTPNAADMRRIRAESTEIHEALRTFSAHPPSRFDLKPPIHGPISSQYGLRRIFNGKPRRPHSGLDIAAPAGTPILAPAAGVVVNTGHYFFDGRTVFLDHGAGMVTMYCHMSEIDVKPGDHVAAGQRLGLVGATGRATGPHLHWGVLLNGFPVNPGLFLPVSSITQK